MRRMTITALSSLVLVALLAVVLCAQTVRPRQTDNTLRTYRVRVNSALAGSQVRVKGALWVDGAARRVEIVDQMTPYDITLIGNIVNGIFEAQSNAQIGVELVDVESGQRRLQKTGVSVVLAHGLAPNTESSFIR